MKRSRIVVAVLLALRAILTSGADLIRPIVRILQSLPLVDSVVAGVFVADYVVWSGNGVSTALNGLVTPTLYLVASYTALTHIYPESVFARFNSPQATRRFKLIAGVLIVVFYESFVFVLDGVYLTLDVGLSTSLLIGWGLAAFLSTVPPIGLAYALSQPAGGLREKPRRENALFIGFVYASWESYLESYDGSWFWHWLRLGLIYLIPVVALAVLFYLLGQFYPLFELVFLTGLVVSVIVPWISFGDTAESFDFETRIADATSVATVNFKGAISVFSLLFGLVAIGWVTIQLLSQVGVPLLDARWDQSWTQLGALVATVQYPIFAGLCFLRAADRLPYFIDEWTDRAPGPDSQLASQASGQKPTRSRIGMFTPAAFVLTAHWYLSHSFQQSAGTIWAITWPMFVGFLVVQYRSNRSITEPLGDNLHLLLLSLVQLLVLMYVASNPVILTPALAQVSSPTIFAGLLEGYVVMCLLYSISYLAPDVINWIKTRWEVETDADQVSSAEYRAMYSFIFLIGVVVIPAVYVATDITAGPLIVYLVGVNFVMVILSRFITVRPDGRTTLSEGRVAPLVLGLWAVGSAVTGYAAVFNVYGPLFGGVVSVVTGGTVLVVVWVAEQSN